MKSDIQIAANRKPNHRFMLNLNNDLYDWIRQRAFQHKTSMSCQINTLIREVQETRKDK